MNNFARRTGMTCLGTAVFSMALIAASGSVHAQEAPKADDRTQFDKYRSGIDTIGPESKALFDKFAKYYAATLLSSETLRGGSERGASWLVNDFDKRLHVPAHNSANGNLYYSRLNANQKRFVEEFGKAAVEALTVPATQQGNPLVRLNATRMIAEVCRSGYDGAAEVCLKVLAKPDENDGVKLYALQGLKNLFEIVPDPDIRRRSIFQNDNSLSLTPVERRSIQALNDFILRPAPAEMTPADVDGILYVRREAVRGLGQTRVQQVRDKGKVECSPSLTLLKVARGDGLTPPSTTPQGMPDIRTLGERVEAIIGFCQIPQPRTDRDLNIDYAVYHIGRAIQDIAPLYRFGGKETSTPWKVSAMRIREALTNWATEANDMKLQDAKLISQLLQTVDADILKPIEESREDVMPNPVNLTQWLQQNQPKSTSLFKNDPKSTIAVP